MESRTDCAGNIVREVNSILLNALKRRALELRFVVENGPMKIQERRLE